MSKTTNIILGFVFGLAWGCLWWRISGLGNGLLDGGCLMAGWFAGDVINFVWKRKRA